MTIRVPRARLDLTDAVLLGAFVFGALLLGGCTTASAPVHDAEVSTTRIAPADWSPFTLGPNDVLRVRVRDHEELSSPFEGSRVDMEGYLHLPQIGAVQVAGRTVVELNQILAEAYGTVLRRPVVTAEVLEYRSRSFYCLGHFAAPGMQFMDRPMSALEAASLGGALLFGADRDNLYLLRPQEEQLEVHRFSLQAPGRDGLVQVLPGDVIFARPTGSWNFQEEVLPILSGLGFTVRNIVDTPVLD